ncbi:hypothetical protein HPHPP16_1600 [Helicobacter pylori Hp P-16]|nr:hypothetical protein HPHPP16_1600 [Helicobacter pylori Hp P-16]
MFYLKALLFYPFIPPIPISSPIISNNFYPFLSNSKFSFKSQKL